RIMLTRVSGRRIHHPLARGRPAKQASHAQIGTRFIDKFQMLPCIECDILDKGTAQTLDACCVTFAVVQRLFLRAVPKAATRATFGWDAPARHVPRPIAGTVRPTSHRAADGLRHAAKRHTAPRCAAVRAGQAWARRLRWFAIGARNAPPTKDSPRI